MRHIAVISETLQTQTRTEMIDVTDRVQRLVRQRGVHEGFVIVYIPHTTAAVTINEHADPDVQHDILAKLDALVPQLESFYQHDEGNSDAHVKTALVGNSVTVLIEKGQLLLGRWQGIFFCEFDGPRERRMNVKIVSLDPPSTD
ncbi:secondary thiamine-phosphate synthase enzyme YjbQ [Fontivita pretiosa]|uniref:secondary thiamine-phosphate synthase enzyme YjbQ n=1 Tax=Fontivita pretiosa TaxID=2989684 RepID=UPI003D163E70